MLLQFPSSLGGGVGGLFSFSPKSFVGKHFIGQIQLLPVSVAKRGRWVYEGSEVKAQKKTIKYFSIKFIVLGGLPACVYAEAP